MKFTSSVRGFEENRVSFIVQPISIFLPHGAIPSLMDLVALFKMHSPQKATLVRQRSIRHDSLYEGSMRALLLPELHLVIHGLRVTLVRSDSGGGRSQLIASLEEVSAILERGLFSFFLAWPCLTPFCRGALSRIVQTCFESAVFHFNDVHLKPHDS